MAGTSGITNKIVKVKVTGAAIDFPNLELIDEDGTKYPLTRSGSSLRQELRSLLS